MCGRNGIKNRIIAAAAVAAVLAIMLFSAFFIAEHVEHDCTGEDCPICACMQLCEGLLRGLETCLTACAAAFAAVTAATASISSFDHFFAGNTPVSRKVRLNN